MWTTQPMLHDREPNTRFNLLFGIGSPIAHDAHEAVAGYCKPVAQQRLPAGITRRHQTQRVAARTATALGTCVALLSFLIEFAQRLDIGEGTQIRAAQVQQLLLVAIGHATHGGIGPWPVACEQRLRAARQHLAHTCAGNQSEVDPNVHGFRLPLSWGVKQKINPPPSGNSQQSDAKSSLFNVRLQVFYPSKD
ncbi:MULTISPECIES: hypothetical protein [Pandoraea]|uniref:hypothetical protein n=1 Tax=Pandoraea TaxID=93217 RepID=UPI001F5CACAF|nr:MULTISPECIES: hypothetical protein [Pandoraea]